MPIGYLVTTALLAGCTLLALVPLRRPGAVGMYFGMLVSELPFIAFYYLLASTWVALDQSGVDTTVGWVAVALAVLTAVGLAVVVRQAVLAGPVVEQALCDGLGDGWRTMTDPALIARLRPRLPYARILGAPFLVRRRDVERLANISYGDAGRANLLDVYRLRSHPSGGPVLVHLHGGSFVGGRKDREARPLLYRLASQGWVCISANYRLSPAARFPDQLIDVKKVIAWVDEHGHEYGAAPSVVFVSGSSAGAYLAAMAALTANDPAFQPGFESVDTSVAAAICLYGYYGPLGTDAQGPSTALADFGPGAPPFFVAHGDHDARVPVRTARRFVAGLRATSSHPVVYAELPGAQHTFDLFASIRFETVVNAVEAFTASVRSRSGERRPQRA